MAKRVPPADVTTAIADHLRAAHQIALLDLGEVGLRTARRSVTQIRWQRGEGDPLGASFRCNRCAERYGEG